MEEVNKKRRDLSNEEKLKLLDKFKKLPKMSQRDAAAKLGISQPLLCKLLKNQSAIETSARSNENLKRKRERSGKDKQVESALKIWFGNVRQKNVSVNGPILRQKAEEIAKTMGKDGFSATDGWFNRWKKRENIVYRSLHGEEKSADAVGASPEVSPETVRNCFRKGGFSKLSDKENEPEFETPELAEQEFADWVDMDQDLQTTNEMTLEDICQEVAGEQSSEEESDSSDEDENIPEPPTNAQMQAAWDILRRGVQYRGTNFEKLYEFENYIQSILNNNKCQTTLDQYFK